MALILVEAQPQLARRAAEWLWAAKLSVMGLQQWVQRVWGLT